MPFVSVVALKDYVGKDLDHSEWFTIGQEWVGQFTECIGNHQSIHVGPEKAAKTPFGDTIAHSFLPLSLVPELMEGLLMLLKGLKVAVNYGLDTVRLIQPVQAGLRVHLGLTLPDVNEKNPGQWLIKMCVTLKTEGQEKPAYIAEILSLCFV